MNATTNSSASYRGIFALITFNLLMFGGILPWVVTDLLTAMRQPLEILASVGISLFLIVAVAVLCRGMIGDSLVEFPLRKNGVTRPYLIYTGTTFVVGSVMGVVLRTFAPIANTATATPFFVWGSVLCLLFIVLSFTMYRWMTK